MITYYSQHKGSFSIYIISVDIQRAYATRDKAEKIDKFSGSLAYSMPVDSKLDTSLKGSCVWIYCVVDTSSRDIEVSLFNPTYLIICLESESLIQPHLTSEIY